jgi:hypothetical protein
MCFFKSGIEIRAGKVEVSFVLDFGFLEPIDHTRPSLAFRSTSLKHGVDAEHNSETILLRILNGYGMPPPLE